MVVALAASVTFVSTASAQTFGERDMNCAGKTLLQSALVMAKAVAAGETVTRRCDVNGDDKIDNSDIRAIQQCDVGTDDWGRCENVAVGLTAGRDKPDYFDEAVDFTESLETPINVTGDLRGHLAFIQSTLVTPSNNVGRPNLVPGRKALLLFFPEEPDQFALSVKVRNGDDVTYYDLAPPENIPRHDGPNGHEAIVYSKRAWSAAIDAEDMQPGVTMRVANGAGKSGTIPSSAFTFGTPTEFTAIALNISMLSGRFGGNRLSEDGIDAELGVDYFNRIPTSKFRIASYEKILLEKVVMPNGDVYTEKSSDTRANEHRGDMRSYIVSSLIGSGIPFANLGIPATSGNRTGEPRPFRQTTISVSNGTYTDGNGNPVVVYHGQSGGLGQVLVFRQTGNELIHEVGHDFGLWHFRADANGLHGRTGGWAYDALRDRLISNLFWRNQTPDGELPWAFGRDPMRSGAYHGSIGFYALHTPSAQRKVQDRLAQSGWHDASSPTGYSQWDQDTQKAVPHDPELPVPAAVGIPVTTIVGFYDPEDTLTSWIAPALHGNWGVTFAPSAVNANTGYPKSCAVRVKGIWSDRVFHLPDTRLNPDVMNKFHVNVSASFKANKAIVTCGGKELVRLDLEPPKGELPEVVEVSTERGGSAEAALGFRVKEASITTRAETIEKTLSNTYGPIHRYEEGSEPVAGALYEFGGGYYQARTAAVGAPPSPNWRTIIADSSELVKDGTVALGEKSQVYSRPGDYVVYSVPADGVDVTASNVSAGRGGWYDKTEYGTITVMATAADGRRQPIEIRVQQNDRWRSNAGRDKNLSTFFRATYNAEDNPEVPEGTYEVDFEVVVGGWHSKATLDAFRVVGSVPVG